MLQEENRTRKYPHELTLAFFFPIVLAGFLDEGNFSLFIGKYSKILLIR